MGQVNISGEKNNKEKLTQLMISYESAVWDFAFSLTRSNDIADDVTQDVFLKAYKNLHKFEGKSAVKTWLLTITRNTVYDRRKSSFFRKVTLIDYFMENGLHPSAEKESIDIMVASEVWKTVLTLPAKLREVLVLYAQHELSVAEIAKVLNISEAAVKSRLHRARQQTASMLNDKGANYEKLRV